MNVGHKIRELRKAKNMTQLALAKACGWSNSVRITHYESNSRKADINDLDLITKALGTNLSEFFGKIDTPKNSVNINQPLETFHQIESASSQEITEKNKIYKIEEDIIFIKSVLSNLLREKNG